MSSRPEQIFRQAFRYAPQPDYRISTIKILNRQQKISVTMVTSISTPRERGSGDFDGENCLQGRGVRFCGFRSLFKTSSKARKNLDTMQMIDIRLQRMPDAIEALYLHMLGNQERLYQQEAAVYIRLMVTSFPLDPSILHFIFIDNRQWSLGPLSSR